MYRSHVSANDTGTHKFTNINYWPVRASMVVFRESKFKWSFTLDVIVLGAKYRAILYHSISRVQRTVFPIQTKVLFHSSYQFPFIILVIIRYSHLCLNVEGTLPSIAALLWSEVDGVFERGFRHSRDPSHLIKIICTKPVYVCLNSLSDTPVNAESVIETADIWTYFFQTQRIGYYGANMWLHIDIQNVVNNPWNLWYE